MNDDLEALYGPFPDMLDHDIFPLISDTDHERHIGHYIDLDMLCPLSYNADS
jgi:hypothetical protein